MNSDFTFMKKIFLFSIIAAFTLLSACSPDNKEAKELLTQARAAMQQQDFARAKANLDSLDKYYPKALNERLLAIPLLDSIRKSENDYIINICDSMLVYFQAQVDSIKKDFVLDEQKHDVKPLISYMPKNIWTQGSLNQTTIRPRVMENGVLHLESVYIGAKQLHDRVTLSVKGGSSAESLPIEGDGFNFRFENLGKNFEIMTITPVTENGLVNFITENQDKNITVKLSGTTNTQYSLSNISKKAIIQSINLSTAMLKVDSLNTEKEKAAFRNYNLKLSQQKDSLNNE